MTMPREQPVWLITGCSSGLGSALARCALQQGFRVAATARSVDDIADLAARFSPTAAMCLALDVTDPGQIAAAVRTVEARWGRIDVLVNNAGIGYIAAIEEGEAHDVRTLFETNVYAVAALTQAALPGMRARRSGCIVNLSSIAGLVGFAGMGYYCATKFAIEGLSEALAAEINPLNIRVVLIEPGPFRTDFFGRSLRQARAQVGDYAQATASARQMSARHGTESGDPQQAARDIIDAAVSGELFVRVPLGDGIAKLASRALQTRLRQVAAGHRQR